VSVPTTIPEALFATAERGAGEYVFHLEDGEVRLSCVELAERALRGAQRLAALGVEPGDAVGVLGPNRPEWVVWAFAAWIAGAALVPVQVPLRVRDPNAFREQLRRLVAAAGCSRVMAEPRFTPLLDEGIAVPWDGKGDESSEAPPVPAPSSTAVIQFTSGSTAAPRGALIGHAAVAAQNEMLDELLRDGGRLRSTLNWTPFFHDLGLFLNVLPAAVFGLTSHHLPTERFARDPAEWLRLIGRTAASATISPAAAFSRALNAVRSGGEQVELGSLEVVRFAAEGVDPQVIRQAVDIARGFDLRPESLGSSYGLAEAVLGVCYSSPGSGLTLDRVSLDDLVEHQGLATPTQVEPSRLLAACGRPKMDLRIVGPDGDLPERHIGEILLRGRSLFSGYVGQRTEDPFVGGWLHTGDLGYLAGGELYVTGRIKDMMIAMGHNYYPEDFEWAAARVEGVRPGRCVAFNPPGTEEVVLLVEAGNGAAGPSLMRQVRNAVSAAVGLPPSEVVVLPPNTVEKTTSGKLKRAAMRDAYLSGALKELSAR
jgi:acyl-CoA synthetase (AMP-forming)/AMP-acid ligase II